MIRIVAGGENDRDPVTFDGRLSMNASFDRAIRIVIWIWDGNGIEIVISIWIVKKGIGIEIEIGNEIEILTGWVKTVMISIEDEVEEERKVREKDEDFSSTTKSLLP